MSDIIGKRINVLDKGWVELLDIMPHPVTGVTPETAIVNAARVSFLGESKGVEKDAKLLIFLLANRHTGPFEQAQMKFRIHAPVVTWWQLVRHRTFSLNLQSGRYTELTIDERFKVVEFMKRRRTKYGEWDLKKWAISAAVVIVGWALITFVRYIFS